MNGLKNFYHFIKISHPDTINFIQKITELGAVVCLDLEDSLSRFNNLDSQLKKNVRNEITEMLEKNDLSLEKIKFGIRINKPRTKDFSEDLFFLKKVINYINIDCIFIPKVEDPDNICYSKTNLKKAGIIYRELIPIIETVNGFVNLEKIVNYGKNEFGKVAFGHCDFNLDNKNFPFHHQYSAKYWFWIKQILDIINPLQKLLINSPFLFLKDEKTFHNMLCKMSSMSKYNFGQISLSLSQTKICSEFKKIKSINSFTKVEYNFNRRLSKELYAEKIINEYDNYLYTNRSFALSPSDRILISPQEYIAAKKYLGIK